MPTTDAAALSTLSAKEMLKTAISHHGSALAIGTSFQHGGLVLIDMAVSIDPSVRVFTIDTGRLHPETVEHVAKVEAHFGITVARFCPDPCAVERMVSHHGPFLFFDSVEKRQHCCRIRKDEPNRRALANVSCWITGLRRDGLTTPRAEEIEHDGRQLLKAAPIRDWSIDEVEAYVAERKIPVNPLYDQGYRSIGCEVCTTPIRPGEERRAGRWRWEKAGSNKECGLHFQDGAGI